MSLIPTWAGRVAGLVLGLVLSATAQDARASSHWSFLHDRFAPGNGGLPGWPHAC
jgi:hypothetical protein